MFSFWKYLHRAKNNNLEYEMFNRKAFSYTTLYPSRADYMYPKVKVFGI